ncbi:hypothetical protein DOTSEDRAFT_74084 [Dothistroma septosporum NZE10]|uniref:AB hydrolase-1 domain-containing protein n=1 Tax=Dothistroma septosporum (strain NZE10 / CBS 128990) TaxID=675120 RepID=N1PHR1_DOTSN|nr:hypothetical protein DOTSEDRAFT_74084 [Dothistroma septosporum NZE10]
MINSSPAEYAFIRVCIFGLQAVGPLGAVYACLQWLLPAFDLVPLPLRIWLWVEAIWYGVSIVWLHKFLQSPAIHPPLRTKSERQALFKKVITNTDPEAVENNVRYWFKGAKFEDIGRDGVKSWIAWAFFEGRIEKDGKSDDELDEYASELERLLGKSFAPGRGKAEPLRLTLDRIDMSHRSILWYFMVGFVDFLTYVRLSINGYHFHRQPYSSFLTLFPLRPIALTASKRSPAKHITYWHRPHTSKTRLPMVFIHGIGIGLYPYVNFFKDLNEHVDDCQPDDDGQVGVIAIEIMAISFRLTHQIMGKDEMCQEILKILDFHGFDRFVLVSHSYGSVLTTHILRNEVLQPRVDSVLLIDPVTFLLHTPDVAYNFTVRQPTHANEWQLWYFASQDPGVAHTLGRHFFWTDNVLWLEDLLPMIKNGMRVTVSLGGRDLIVDTKVVGKYLGRAARTLRVEDTALGEDSSQGSEVAILDADWKQSEWRGQGLDVIWFDDTDHAQVFDKKEKRAKLVKVVRGYCDSGSISSR